MIYPDVQLSNLSAEADASREKLHRSQDALSESVQRKLSPISVITQHKGLLMALLSGLFLFLKWLWPKKKVVVTEAKAASPSLLIRLAEAGWIWKALQVGWALYQNAAPKKKSAASRRAKPAKKSK